jgi:hypothetical protein
LPRPEHADSFVLGWPAGAKPEDVAARAMAQLEVEPVVFHSTSWRHASAEVVLTYIAVVPSDAAPPPSWQIVEVHDYSSHAATRPLPQRLSGSCRCNSMRCATWPSSDRMTSPFRGCSTTGPTPSPITSRSRSWRSAGRPCECVQANGLSLTRARGDQAAAASVNEFDSWVHHREEDVR